MIADLHTHTNCSDGTLTPIQLLERAAEAGVDMLAITDHDTVNAYQGDFQQQAEANGIQLIQGIELSTTWQRMGVHIVGLNIDFNTPKLQQGITEQTIARGTRAVEIAEKLQKLGIDNALEGAQQFAANGFIGRPHFAQFLVASGRVKTIQQAFKRYLGSGKPGDIKQHWAEMEDVISWIRDSGGAAVLAHPLKYKLTRTKLRRLTEDFIELGGTAIEVISGQQTPSDTQLMGQICREKALLASTGSDFHTPGQSWAALGKQPTLPDGCQPVWGQWAKESS